jgi:ATP-binding cassette subfamily B protein
MNPLIMLSGHKASGVVFGDVGFHYNGDTSTPVLEHIDIDGAPGRVIAILGATGSGKSTLVNLIPRFYDVTSGAIRIDGLPVKTLAHDSLLERIGIVSQETLLFSGSVRDNIRYGRPTASDADVVAAAKVAHAHDFILELPRSYDTRIEERGVNLSGGQKQRIAIARAIITHPAILILDDSTSAVDVETETGIQEALAEFMDGCTIFMVAQLISTVLNADMIIVLDQGRIAAQGTHAELLRSSDVYREIYDSQLGGGIHE